MTNRGYDEEAVEWAVNLRGYCKRHACNDCVFGQNEGMKCSIWGFPEEDWEVSQAIEGLKDD